MNYKTILFVLLMFINYNMQSQSLTLDEEKSSFTIKGTSTIHDWEMVSNELNGHYTIQDGNLSSTSVNVNVTTFKSGKNLMDKKCYDALLYKKHPQIIYSFISENKSPTKLIFTGSMEIAGVKKIIDITVNRIVKNGTVTLTGSADLKLSDYNVVPPKALMGTIKTGNDITIEFNLKFK